ncbi:MAG: 2-oxo-4-hydroxy-4-carboxy-5-ureidoimidazoline decarboxylase [Rhodanobacteraceae bacterium]|nr:2-oxo-4-hydroxy-4-carboxy-5-ureidoimidazoline decarboxylase [Rhodanobacteraceae bacterium]
MNLTELNGLSQADFTAALAGIFEHSPWIPEATWPRRPFASVDELHAQMCATLAAADLDAKLALIRAHPELAGKLAIRGELTDASLREQAGAGLNQCSPEEFSRLTELNAAYIARFGFPFILAVRGHDRDSIIANMAARVANEREVEIATALAQIERIAGFRLGDLVAA